MRTQLISTISAAEIADGDEYRWFFYTHKRVLNPTQKISKLESPKRPRLRAHLPSENSSSSSSNPPSPVD